MITVIGSVNLDLVARVDRLPGCGETVSGSTFRTSPGGKGANQALAARRAGAKVRLAGAVGRDGFAEEATALLRQAGVELTHLRRIAAPTGTALILVGPDGQNMIAVVPGANGTVGPSDVAAATLAPDDLVLLQLEIPVAAVAAALDAARRAGARSILNIAPFRAEAVPLAARADIVVANETEFDLLADALGIAAGDRPGRLREAAGATGNTIVVTLGVDGALCAGPKGWIAVAALPVRPVDTVGAGDTFCGYFAAGLASGLALEEALRRACIAGSLACLHPGAQPSIPHARDVDEAMREGGA